jgi:hypothetical protein
MSIVTPDLYRPEAITYAPRLRHGAGVLRGLEAIILLSGGIRTDEFSTAVGRSVLELPIDDHSTVLDQWVREGAALAALVGSTRLSFRVITNDTPPRPRFDVAASNLAFQVERDPGELRGTGGVLADVCGRYPENARLLVATGARLLSGSLAAAAASLAAAEADVALAAHEDGAPGGLMLIRAGCLKEIPGVGFIDLQEQGLPLIAHRHSVRVVRRCAGLGAPVRTSREYIAGIRAYLAQRAGVSGADPFAEQCFAKFAIREEFARVASDAILHDSVVLAGGCVEAGAVVVRSVVCPGAVVRRGRTVVDQTITTASRSLVSAWM